MNLIKLEKIGALNFRDKIKINGKVLYRGQEYGDINTDLSTQEKYWEYTFYTKWDKKKNILPPVSHIIRVYASFKKKIKKGHTIFELDKYLKGILKDLQNNSEEIIIEISV